MSNAILIEQLESTKVNRLDILVFVGSFFGGLVVYFVLRQLGVPQRFVTTSIIGVMLVYAAIVAIVPRLRVRLDQAGDNAYYLGLLFTLSSMAVALYEFGGTQIGSPTAAADGSGARQIIGNFGIALATTITGIFLRVFLHQMRVDPADVESMTRIELAEAAKRVKATLDSVSVEMGRLLDEMRQRTGDQLAHLVEAAVTTLVDFTSRVTTATKELTEATSAAHTEAVTKVSDVTRKLLEIANEAEAAVSRLRQVEPPPLKLATRLEKVSDALHKVAGETERVGERLADAGEVSGKVSQTLADAATKLVGASETSIQLQQDALKQIGEAASGVKEVLEAVGRTLEEDRRRLGTLEEQNKKAAQAALESQEAAKRVLDSLVKMTRGLTEFINNKG